MNKITNNLLPWSQQPRAVIFLKLNNFDPSQHWEGRHSWGEKRNPENIHITYIIDYFLNNFFNLMSIHTFASTKDVHESK